MTRIKSKPPKAAPTLMHDNIHKLPLSVFIDCVVRQDFAGLYISGEVPTVDDFYKSWDKIYYDYLDAIGGDEFKSETEKLSEWVLKQSRLVRFEQLAIMAEKVPCETLYKMIFDFGYDIPKKEYNEENLKAAMQQALPQFKLDKTRIEIELAEQKDGVKAETVPYSDEYFLELIIEIGTTFKMDLNEQNLTLGKFCSYLNKYRKHRALIEKELLKNAFN